MKIKIVITWPLDYVLFSYHTFEQIIIPITSYCIFAIENFDQLEKKFPSNLCSFAYHKYKVERVKFKSPRLFGAIWKSNRTMQQIIMYHFSGFCIHRSFQLMRCMHWKDIWSNYANLGKKYLPTKSALQQTEHRS